MKKMKRILALMLCLTMAISGPLSVFAEETDAAIEENITEEEKSTVCEICQQEPCTCEPVEAEEEVTDAQEGCAECGNIEGHAEKCSFYEAPVLTVVEQLLEAENVEEMYLLVLNQMQNDPESLKALSADEIAVLRERIDELDPEGDDVDTQDLLDTLAVLPNGGEELVGDLVILEDNETITNDQTWEGNSTLSKDTIWNFKDGAIVTLKNPITIPSGKTLTLKGWGGFARYSNNVNEIFIVNSGGKLVIEGISSDQPIIIDGESIIANKSLITSSGDLNFTRVRIQNGKNRASKSSGGGIVIGSGGNMIMNECVVTRNTATEFGGGIYCAGTMTINNSVISYNVAATDSEEATNLGRGGGFDVYGKDASCTLNNTIIEYNSALYYGGGGQVKSGATVTMNTGTIFRYNRAELHGAGALHITGDAKFVMNGGSMENNFAQYCGGAIHSSYSCVLELNAGEIKNNETNGRGGGIHINTGGAITLNEKIIISGNRANKQKVGTSADVDQTGDSITNIKYEGTDTDFGYGGGILIDSGTCTVAGATITNNYAEVGGGGIALTMLNMGKEGLDDLMVIKFTMTAGTVSNNTTDGNGAGVYIMTNKAENNLKKVFPEDATEENYQWALGQITQNNKHEFDGEDIINGIPEAVVSGGTIQNNVATNNGGGLYLGENTKFIISGGSISANKAVDGAGVYVASGVAEINGGTMTANVASNDGGALYIEGDVTMNNGSIGGEDIEAKANTAVNGGAMYVSNGNVTIEHGTISGNKAIGSGDDLQDTTNNTGRGGSVYLAGDENTVLTMKSGTMNKNQASNDGGAIFATGGTILIGLESCSTEKVGADCEHHMGERHHPIINENKAGDTGGGIALTEGVVRFYCGRAKNNQALYKGVGKNVFMDGGEFYLYDGADVGVSRDPDLVIVGGELYNECAEEKYITLNYYMTNDTTEKAMTGLAEYKEHMNLPAAEYYWPDYAEKNNLIFVGWTAQGAVGNKYVRNKEHYVASGEPVQILDHEPNGDEPTDEQEKITYNNTMRMFDGTKDDTINLYAIWAPKTSNITYVDKITGTSISNTPTSYEFNRESNIIEIDPVAKPGYDLVGWYIYQNDNQNANWNPTLNDKTYEPVYLNNGNIDYNNLDYDELKYIKLSPLNSSFKLEAGYTNFGDITLIADYELAYADLQIIKSGADEVLDENQTFIFKITGNPCNPDFSPIELEAVIKGNGKITIEHLPVGNYTIEELSGWSWRYESVVENGEQTIVEPEKIVDLNDSTKEFSVEFTNRRQNTSWLDGSSHAQNIFGTSGIISSGNIYQKGGN